MLKQDFLDTSDLEGLLEQAHEKVPSDESASR